MSFCIRIVSATGGMDQTFTARTVPDLTTWVSTAYSMPQSQGPVIRIGANLYMFGGLGSAKIYSTAWSAPTGWADTGSVMPEAKAGFRVCVIDDNIYAFGAVEGSNKIHVASRSDPLTWAYTGSDIDTTRDFAQVMLTKDKVVIIDGYDGANAVSSIGSATLVAPTVWSTTAGADGSYKYGCAVDAEGYPVTFQGAVSVGAKRFNKSGTTRMELNALLPQAMSYSPECWHIDKSLWVYGNNTTNVYYGEIKDLMQNFSILTGVLPGLVSYNYGSDWIGSDNKLYVNIGGTLYASGLKTIYSEAQTANSSVGLYAVEDDGNPTCVSRSCILGFRSWLTNRTDML